MDPLTQLYPIHFDNYWAYVGGEHVTWANIHPLIEIVTFLSVKYHYHNWKYDPLTSTITHNSDIIPHQPCSQRNTIPVLHTIVEAILALWHLIKQQLLQF